MDIDTNRPDTRSRLPNAQMTKQDESYLLDIELPGINKEDFDIRVSKSGVEIKVKQEHEATAQTDESYRYVQNVNTFYRFIPLPTLEPSSVAGSFQNGVLHLRLPKVEADSSPIEIE